MAPLAPFDGEVQVEIGNVQRRGMSPMVTNGDNSIGANGANDDPFEIMMIHWPYNVPMAKIVTTFSMMMVATLAPMATMTIYKYRKR